MCSIPQSSSNEPIKPTADRRGDRLYVLAAGIFNSNPFKELSDRLKILLQEGRQS